MIEHDSPQQLTLLPSSSDVPVKFRLDAETRARGLRHIAEIRRQLAERQATRQRLDQLRVRAPVRRDAA